MCDRLLHGSKKAVSESPMYLINLIELIKKLTYIKSGFHTDKCTSTQLFNTKE